MPTPLRWDDNDDLALGIPLYEVENHGVLRDGTDRKEGHISDGFDMCRGHVHQSAAYCTWKDIPCRLDLTTRTIVSPLFPHEIKLSLES